MKVGELFVYPIKSLRGVSIPATQVTPNGFPYDRRFMLMRAADPGPASPPPPTAQWKNMHIAHVPEMALFHVALWPPSSAAAGDDGSLTVTYRAPDEGIERGADAPPTPLRVPLQPKTAGLWTREVVMHRSPTTAYDMGPEYDDWFSARFGFPVKLVYLGGHLRPVLMSTTPDGAQPGQPQQTNGASPSWPSWLSAIARPITGAFGPRKEEITFADCAPFLVASSRSLANVSARLPEGEKMDMSKFRPNIVIDDAPEDWDEDFWAELRVGDDGGSVIHCVHNCVRCISITVDYKLGKFGTGEAGSVLKKMQRDRRVDAGSKYDPVFGRYSFLRARDEGKTISVGDEVTVTQRNTERSRFDWPGIGQNP
ncbi:MOSC domain-containing protein [Lineolata rhizophorae]|uniref:MOSC domain-containing protein n=1 Tax=Lineolata rhizophorae TaxID=578093 RepID=A0A6A6NUZ0_9PEZI|nr:MOSC domain-containing protein [Lineolata rhizophorae]